MLDHIDDYSFEITFKAEELYFLAAQQAFQEATALRDEVLTKGQDYSLAKLLFFAEVYDLGDEIDLDVVVNDFDETKKDLRGGYRPLYARYDVR